MESSKGAKSGRGCRRSSASDMAGAVSFSRRTELQGAHLQQRHLYAVDQQYPLPAGNLGAIVRQRPVGSAPQAGLVVVEKIGMWIEHGDEDRIQFLGPQGFRSLRIGRQPVEIAQTLRLRDLQARKIAQGDAMVAASRQELQSGPKAGPRRASKSRIDEKGFPLNDPLNP